MLFRSPSFLFTPLSLSIIRSNNMDGHTDDQGNSKLHYAYRILSYEASRLHDISICHATPSDHISSYLIYTPTHPSLKHTLPISPSIRPISHRHRIPLRILPVNVSISIPHPHPTKTKNPKKEQLTPSPPPHSVRPSPQERADPSRWAHPSSPNPTTIPYTRQHSDTQPASRAEPRPYS